MKILLVHNQYRQPGGEDVVFEQERELLERNGHEITVYKRSNLEIQTSKGLQQQLALVRNSVWSAETRREFAARLDRIRPDLVHVHNTFVVISPSIYSACQDAGVPVVQTLHNYRLYCPSATFFRDGRVCEDCVDRGLWESVRHGCYHNSHAETAAVGLMLVVHRQRGTYTQKVSRYIALTEFAKSRFVNAGLPPEKISVKPNFVYPDPGTGESVAGNYALFVGRLSPEKRVSTMLRAWEKVPEIPLVVIGGGPEHTRLQDEAASRGLERVTFRGQLSRAATIEAMRGARFLVFSSEWYENFPVTIAESFACGLPVICCSLGAMAEIVRHGETGLHFRVGDPSDLAETVSWAWANPRKLEMMGRRARQEFEMKYTAERNYPMLMEIYGQVLGGEKRICWIRKLNYGRLGSSDADGRRPVPNVGARGSGAER